VTPSRVPSELERLVFQQELATQPLVRTLPVTHCGCCNRPSGVPCASWCDTVYPED
jgi:hypothetical protein